MTDCRLENVEILLLYIIYFVSRDSSVGITTGYGLDEEEAGVRVPVG
jgi:hypothetical protein